VPFNKGLFLSLFKLAQIDNIEELINNFIKIMNSSFPELNFCIKKSDKNPNLKLDIKIKNKINYSIYVFGNIEKYNQNETKSIKECTDILSLIIEDLSQRKKTSKDLPEFDKNIFFNHALDMLCIAGIDGYFKQINPLWTKTLGYTEEELLSKPWLDFVHPDDKELTITAGKNLKKGENIIQFRNRYRCKDGSYKWLSWNSYPDIKTGIIYGVARDITEIIKSEEALKKSETKFRNIVESSPLGIHLYKLYDEDNLIFTGYSPSAEKILRLKLKKFLGKNILEAFPSLKDTIIPDKYKEIAKTGNELFLEEVNYKDNNVEGIFEIYAFQTAQNEMAVMFNDITKRKKSENALKESEERYKKLVETMTDGLAVMDANGTLKYVNDSLCSTLGFSRKQIIGKNILSFFDDKNQKILQNQIEKRKNGILESYEIEWLGKNNKKTSTLMSPQLVFDENNIYKESFVVVTDISRIKKAEKSLKESEVRFKEIFENANDGINIVDIETTKLIMVNKSICNMLGYEKNELIGKLIKFIHPKKDYEYILNIFKEMSSNKMKFASNVPVLKKDGTVFFADITSSIININGKKYIIGIFRDITKQKEYIEALKESEEKFRSLSEQSPNMIFINKKGKVVYINHKCKEILGYAKDEFLSNDFNFMQLVAPESIDLIKENFKKHLKGDDILPYEYVLITKEGRKIFSIISTKIITYEGETAFLGIVTDITQRKEAEIALKESEERYKYIFNNSPIGITIANFDGKIISANTAMQKLLNYSNEELTNLNFSKIFFLPDEWQNIKNIINKNETISNYYIQLKKKDGLLFHALFNLTIIRLLGEKLYQITLIDISERKKFENALKESEERYKRISQTISDYIYSVIINDGKIIKTIHSPTCLSVTGYSQEELNKNPHLWIEMVFKDDHYIVSEYAAKALNGEKLKPLEHRIVKKNGEVIWVRNTIAYHHDKNKKLISYDGIVQDITDKKTAEEALIKSEKEKSIILNTMSELIAYYETPDLRIVWANKSAAESVNYSINKLVNHHCYKIWHNRDLPCDSCPIIKVFNTGEPHENEIISPDGRIWHIKGYPVKDNEGKLLGVVEDTINITKQKKAEEELIKERDKAQKYLSIAEVMLLVLDFNGNLTLLNPKGEKILGYKEKELIGKNWFNTCLPKDIKQTVKDVFYKLINGEIENLEYFENSIIDKEGNEKLIAWHNTMLKDNMGKIIGTLSSGEDITDRRKSEEEREKLLHELSSKNEELKSIVYVASHDLRTPLINIQGFSRELELNCNKLNEMLKNNKLEKNLTNGQKIILDKEIPESVNYIISNVKKIDQLLDGLLKISRLGRETVEMINLNMNLMIHDIINAMQYQIQKDKVKVIIKNLPPCFGNETQINQVCYNLINNAIKYIKNKGENYLKITGYKDGKMSVYCFEDNGIGIHPNHQKKIFEIFHRLNPKGPIKGEGLGLTIVKRIIDRHNGSIWLESNEGKGSKFYISLPSKD